MATSHCAESQQFVTFRLDAAEFGLPLLDVLEIIRVPDLVPVPLTHSAVLGIANLRGTVLPVTSLRRSFGMPERDMDDASRVVVVLDRGAPVGVVVDRMSSVLTVEDADIEDADRLHALSGNEHLVDRVVRGPSGRIMVFDPAKVLAELSPAPVEGRTTKPPDAANKPAEAERRLPDRQLVSFVVGKQEYALPIERVKEIITLPEDVVLVPRGPPALVGMMTLRDRVLPLVSAGAVLGLEPAADGPRRVVVTTGLSRPGLEVGLVVDAVKEVLRLSHEQVEDLPPLLKSGSDELLAVCRLGDGSRTVTLVDVDRLLDVEAVLEAALEGAEAVEEATRAEQSDEEQVVVFRLRGDRYGVPIQAVQEIVRLPEEITAVPRASSDVLGIMNLRGQILPVVDLRARLGIASAERSDRQRIVVLCLKDLLTGFVVDSVSEVRRIPRHRIGPAPSLTTAQAAVVQRVARLEDDSEIVLLVEPARLHPPSSPEDN